MLGVPQYVLLWHDCRIGRVLKLDLGLDLKLDCGIRIPELSGSAVAA